MTISKTAAQVYEAVLNGDPLTDVECREGLSHFRSLADLLWRSGVEFRQAFRAANQAAQQLEGFIASRSERCALKA